MNHNIIPTSRLTLIFILAVVLSGSVLTWFSISNISNLKGLTEKRVMEEQRELSSRFLSELQNTMDNLTTVLNNEINQPGEMKNSLLKIANKEGFIIQSFILDKNGRFLYPNFAGISENKLSGSISMGFRSAFRDGEKAEFSETDFLKAKKNYLECLRLSTNGNDSAKAINALGRVAVKSGFEKEATGWYHALIKEHFNEVTEEGTPYVYFAIPQLMKSRDNFESMLKNIGICLEQTESGNIHMNFITEDFLNQITSWIKGHTYINTDQLTEIQRIITLINRQVRFVNVFGKEISELTGKSNPGNNPPRAGDDFRISNAVSDSIGAFFLIHVKRNNPAGFLIDRRVFLDSLAKINLQSGLEFDYKIDFPESYHSPDSGEKLVYSVQLNPWLPDQTIRIRLKNEELIKKFIIRRSWIYGVSSILLMLAMFLGIMLILRDMAREKRLARLRSDFVSNVTHELKTPLTSIRLYAESLLMDRVKTASGRKEYLSVVINESERLKRMINNILEFSKMEKAKQEYHIVESDLPAILLAAIHDMNYWMEEKGFKIMTEIDSDIKIKVDPEKIRQVFTNLLSNAIKYSGDSRKIFVRLYKTSGAVITEVEDEGIGISKDKLVKIFEAFYRVEMQESGDISGTGLGLTVVKEIVEAHKGTIKVTSENGKGSIFTVSIPLG